MNLKNRLHAGSREQAGFKMKIQGPGPPKKPPVADAGQVEKTGKGETFSSVLSSSSARAGENVSKAGGSQPASSVLSPEGVKEIASRIRAEKLGRTEAADLLVRKVVDAQMGDAAGNEKIQTLVERVREVVETDPFLSKQLDELLAMAEEK